MEFVYGASFPEAKGKTTATTLQPGWCHKLVQFSDTKRFTNFSVIKRVLPVNGPSPMALWPNSLEYFVTSKVSISLTMYSIRIRWKIAKQP